MLSAYQSGSGVTPLIRRPRGFLDGLVNPGVGREMPGRAPTRTGQCKELLYVYRPKTQLANDLRAAQAFIDRLTGERGAPVHWQVFPDRKGGKGFPWHRQGHLKPMARDLMVAQQAGCGVYCVPNETDGIGREAGDVRQARAVFADLDGSPLPESFPLEPHIIVETSPGRYHLYWLIEPTDDLAGFSDVQARLASFYKSDPRIHDPSRVMRVPGFWHLKSKPFMVHTVKACSLEQAQFDRYSFEDIEKAHPCQCRAPELRDKASRVAEPPHGFDNPQDIEGAILYLKNEAPPAIEGRGGDLQTFKVACVMRDFGLSEETAFEQMAEHYNSRCDPPWNTGHDADPRDSLRAKVRNAYASASGDAGSRSIMDLVSEPLPTAEELARLDEAMPLLKLAHVNADTVDKMFKLVNVNGKMRVLYWGSSQLDKMARVPQFWSVAEFRNALANKVVRKTVNKGDGEKATKRIPMADYWLEKPDRYTYDGVVLESDQESHADSINLWRGFGVEPDPFGQWDLIRSHIEQVIANGDRESADYILRWLAWAVQHPTEPCEVALILKSAAHGTGKGMLLRAVRKLFGVHGMQISKSGLLTGRFNAHLAMCCFLFVDEMTLADNRETAALNSLLTEDAIAIEPKGVDAFMLPNHVKVAAASNQEHVVNVADSDRRFAVFEVGDVHARDHAYFARITRQLEAGGYGAMLNDLLAMDVGGWHPRQGIPANKAKAQQKVESAAPEIQWLAGYLDSGFLDCQVPHRGGNRVNATDFLDRAKRDIVGMRNWTPQRFAKFLREWGARPHKRNTKQWSLPPLGEMRAAFRERFPWWPPFEQEVSDWIDADRADLDEYQDYDFG